MQLLGSFKGLVVGVAAVAAIAVIPQPAYADAGDVETDTMSAVSFPGSELELVPGDEASSSKEEVAVEEFIAQDPLLTDASDVSVDTVPFGPGDIVVVAPTDEINIESVDVAVDPETNEVTFGGDMTADVDQPVTSGAGMGAWPKWIDRPQYQVRYNMYFNGNYIGMGRFSTQVRKRDMDTGPDLWQVARTARGEADAYEVSGPDYDTHVQKLWISSKLTSNPDNAYQWYDSLTEPLGSEKVCNSTSGAVGPWEAGFSDCDESDAWQGEVGHMRVSFDQGSVTGGGSRYISYVAGFSTKAGSTVTNHFYQFVTLRVGDSLPGTGMIAGTPFKCAGEDKGSYPTQLVLDCKWD